MKGNVLASRYELQDRLGVGGSSTVFRAIDRRLDVPVAVKLLDPDVASNEQALTRFLHEAKTAAKLKHAHVAQSLDCGVDEGVPFIVMELLEGQTLRERLRDRGRLSPLETARILSDVAKAIQLAHSAGVVHRDLKPENVFLVYDQTTLRDGSSEAAVEVVKVLDFGIAKSNAAIDQNASAVRTEPGSLFGTPNYMSPEQIDARCPIDHRVDVWALGIMAFECLTGRVPFREQSLREQFLAICARPLPVPSQIAEVPAGFDQWFERAAAQDVASRFSSIREAQLELARICGHEVSTPAAALAPGNLTTPPSATPPSATPPSATPPSATPPSATPRVVPSREDGQVNTESDSHAPAPGIRVNPLPARSLNWLLLLGLFVVLGFVSKGWWMRAEHSRGSAPSPKSSPEHAERLRIEATSVPTTRLSGSEQSPSTLSPSNEATGVALQPSMPTAAQSAAPPASNSPPKPQPASRPPTSDLISRAVKGAPLPRD